MAKNERFQDLLCGQKARNYELRTTILFRPLDGKLHELFQGGTIHRFRKRV